MGILVDLAGIGVVRVAGDLTVVTANETAARLLARSVAALPGRSVIEAFTDHRLEEIVRAALRTGAAAGELTIRTADAPTLLVRARRTPAGDAWLVLEDVTELRRLQRIRTEFIDNIAHELRTPLTTVSLLAETLALEAAQLPPRTAERIAKIEVETGHLVQMVNELLDLSKIESGSTALVLGRRRPGPPGACDGGAAQPLRRAAGRPAGGRGGRGRSRSSAATTSGWARRSSTCSTTR